MKRYAIANYLPESGKRVAVEAEYVPAPAFERPQRLVSPGGFCPLGLALRDLDLTVSEEPDSEMVATILIEASERTDLDWEYLAGLAVDFINDWDSGKIDPADLPAIFGVTD